uniref:Scaffolding protein n=1 Tax=viral metagenome TaxID=1070528 RepID=A0A6H1ZF55_9ZZZZ
MADEPGAQTPQNQPGAQGTDQRVAGGSQQPSEQEIQALKQKYPWWDGKPIDLDRADRIIKERREFKGKAEAGLSDEQKNELADLRKYREEQDRKGRTEIENLQADLEKERKAREALVNENRATKLELLAVGHGAKNPAFARWYIEQEQAKNPDAKPEDILTKLATESPEQFGTTDNGSGGEGDERKPDPKAAAQGGAGALASGEKGLTLQEVEKAIDDHANSGEKGPRFLKKRFALLRMREQLLNMNPPDRESAQKLKEEQAARGGQRNNANQ